MDEQTKLIRILINGQSSIKSELLSEVKKNRDQSGKQFEKLGERMKKLEERIDKLETNLTKRIDKIGLSEAQLIY